MRSSMSFASKCELLAQVAPRYREVGHQEKTAILDQFVAATGYARKYAIRLLQQPLPLASKEIRRPRERHYGPEVQAALAIAWTAANCICGKRLVPFLPELVPLLEAHGHLSLTDEVRNQLLAISPARLHRAPAGGLRPLRGRGGLPAVSRTLSGGPPLCELLPTLHEAGGEAPGGESKVQRRYDAAQTPFQRLVASGTLAEETVQHWTQVFQALDPVRLPQQIQALQDALWRHALPATPTTATGSSPQAAAQHVRFNLQACLPGGDDNDSDLTSTAATTVGVQKRKYRRTQKSLGLRTYRTHPDPFEAVKSELHQWFLAAPDRPVKCLLQELQARYPGRYPDNLLRTLQRRVSEWRREVILAFDDGLMREDALLHQSLPVPLRAIPVKDPTSGEMAVETSLVG